jgi:hypothetical protein
MNGSTLLASKAALQNSTLYQKWVRDNPKESARVERYWQMGDMLPTTATAFGLHYSLDAHAYHQATAPLPFIPI